MTTEFLTIIVGIALILGLAEVITRNAIGLSEHFQVSGSFIGLTILSVGTSIPEIMTHLAGSARILQQPETMDRFSGLVVGANTGATIFEQNFSLPLISLVGTIVIMRQLLIAKVGVLVGTSVLVWFFSVDGEIDRIEGFILVTVYGAYLLYLAQHQQLTQEMVFQEADKRQQPVLKQSLLIVLSFGVMAVAADQVVDSANRLVDLLSISASLLGILLLGIAAALPELTIAFLSIFKGHQEISAGVLIGSNITNFLLGIGLGALVSRYTVPDPIIYYDLPVKVATAILLYFFLLHNEVLSRRKAAILILLFIGYLLGRSTHFPEDFPQLVV
ncbi:sodium/calcium exchanger membrane region [Nitrosococcus halophilus Nc 4]|uniref:Sodium/calcium exchanger membrane region n=1 Tax=Nitrosococcus halophilus (strain Nc4) TaxID=472759 RepID=D5BXA1_NITHN|nr:sodium:calcium antiporter [Nitrosococcus halophilus]ADE15784.1 sodium/calcium exchanger membrane region [Nitrosococcus halophilus Nc 4]